MTEYGQWDLVVASPEDEPARGSCRGREAHAVWVATSWKQSRASVNLPGAAVSCSQELGTRGAFRLAQMPPERAKPGCQHCRALPSRRPRGRWPAGQLKLCPLSAPRRLIARPCPPTALQEEGPGRSVGPPASHRGSLEGQGAQAHPTPSRGLESRAWARGLTSPAPGWTQTAPGAGAVPPGARLQTRF